MLRATTACNFSSLIWPDGSAPAPLASLLFDPSKLQIIGKTQWTATFLPFRALASSFFWLFLFFDLLSSALLLSGSYHLCFSICPYCRKFDFETSFDQSIKTIENQTRTNPNTKQIPTLHHRNSLFLPTACPQPGAEVGSKSLRLGEVSGASNTEPCSRLLEKTGLL